MKVKEKLCSRFTTPKIDAMLRSPLNQRLLVMVCLALLQGQLWATSLLACQHLGGMPKSADVCPLHGVAPSVETTSMDTTLECPKCALHCTFAGFHPPAPPAAVDALHGDPTRKAVFVSVWDDITPQRFLRPPINAGA